MTSQEPMRKILVIDIGNTNTKCAVYSGEDRQIILVVDTNQLLTADELYTQLSSCSIPWTELDFAVMASVVPQLDPIWQVTITGSFGVKLLQVDSSSPLGLSFPYPDPRCIGADLVINAFAVWKKYRSNCILIDLGTATKIQLVNSSGFYEAAAIIPGLATSAKCLTDKAARLSDLELRFPDSLLGSNTTDALLSGIVWGHCLMLEAYIAQIKQEYPEKAPLKVVLTGGLANLVSQGIKNFDIVDPFVTLQGLYLAGLELCELGL